MVLSWRGGSQGNTSRIFDGSGDVRMFLFYFENVIAREIEEGKKSYELLAHLDGEAFEFFFSLFTKEGVLTDEALDFKKVRKALLQKFVKREQPQDIIRESTDGILDAGNLTESMMKLDSLFC